MKYRPLTKEDVLHARIRDLKDKNVSLSRVNSEMQQELKEVSEKNPNEENNGKSVEEGLRGGGGNKYCI